MCTVKQKSKLLLMFNTRSIYIGFFFSLPEIHWMHVFGYCNVVHAFWWAVYCFPVLCVFWSWILAHMCWEGWLEVDSTVSGSNESSLHVCCWPKHSFSTTNSLLSSSQLQEQLWASGLLSNMYVPSVTKTTHRWF